MVIRIHTQSLGRPQTLSDSKGTWRSAIFRRPVDGPVELGFGGLAGDQVTDTRYHGDADKAVCCYFLSHYFCWNVEYSLAPESVLGPGAVGENWTLDPGTEEDVFIGDIYQAGTSRVQVSAPRFPCWKQERKLGLPSFLERTIATMRTGFYVRVLTPGAVAAGDALILESRPNPRLSVCEVNRSIHRSDDNGLATSLLKTPELAESWKRMVVSSRKSAERR